MRCRVTWARSSSDGERGRHLPLAVIVEPAQSVDAVPAVAAETEVERLRRYLEVSQFVLEAAEPEMQVV
jgi:hypothetical protein